VKTKNKRRLKVVKLCAGKCLNMVCIRMEGEERGREGRRGEERGGEGRRGEEREKEREGGGY
jgi:hypothetical protein